MKKSFLVSKLETISDGVFFIPLLIYHLIFLFQGIDFADEGFHATFYQQIFTHPESMIANFMYWLTGIVGGSFYYLFPDWGLFGLRIQGVAIIFSTMLVVYYLLKDYISLLHLRLGVLILVLFTTNEIKEMHYDTQAALLNVSSAFLLFKGLIDNKYYKIALSGAFISLSMFTRLPSIVLLVFFVAVIYYGLINRQRYSFIIRQIFYLFAGFLLTTIAVLLFMKWIGHLSYYVETLKIVFDWGRSADDSHNLTRLIKVFINDYSQSLKYASLIIIFLFILNALDNLRLKNTRLKSSLITKTVKIGIICIFLYLILKQHITYSRVIMIFSGFSLITAILIFISSNYTKEIKLLTLLGVLVLFFEPLGSAWGLSTAGRHSLWIIFPITIDYIFNLKTINGKFRLSTGSHENIINISAGQDQLAIFKVFFIGFCLFICVYFSYYYPYFDMSNRITMTSAIENKLAKGIYTTPERAKVINELLTESSKYIKKDDSVLAYDCMPMFHFLTETRPYMSNTWPWLYVPETFKLELLKASNMSKELPVIILQKVNTLNTDWPENNYRIVQKTKPEIMRDSILNEFMKVKLYVKVWENKAFEIRVPEKLF